ncbi:hypothetical protein QYE76_054097 [Lolium multiflorum]|uniref:ATPase AAA-type core domain-containing protein n=1 Tax=Lolium multiflorum TaxID=4521 RepID=A0AAD8SX08_LOLMU|nr:hypothetical protein QYE76_054097 [Lolium multiflorum]
MKLMVAAISNHLHFDLYDLDVGDVGSNTELWKVLVRMKNRSILLVEDVDCDLTTAPWRDMNGEGPDGSSPASKNHKVSLSGLLNMVDGLWSSSGHERILIFTTNHKDRLSGWTWRCSGHRPDGHARLHGLLRIEYYA